jgi:hypothetical protein
MDMVSVRQVKVEPPPKPSAKQKKSKKREFAGADQPTFFDEPIQDSGLSTIPSSTALGSRAIAKPERGAAELERLAHPGTLIPGSDGRTTPATNYQEPMRSVSSLACEEQRHLDNGLQLLGDTYDLITDVEKLFDALPSLCKFPSDSRTNDATYAALLTRELMRVCRRQLTLGTLTLLRRHRVDSNFHLRKAIELCAYAAKMGKHPHMARLWIEARKDEQAFDKFKDKFKKLFPQYDPELTKLGHHYDECSKAMHSSIYGVAGYFAAHVATGNQPGAGIDIFDTTKDATVIVFFFHETDAYLTMLRVFGRLLAVYAGEQMASWTAELAGIEETFRVKRDEWIPFIKKTTPTGT